MRQRRTRVVPSTKLRSRVRTYFRRSKFVSYSGSGSFKAKVKRDENTPRIKKLNSVALVRERTIPTERPPPVGEVSAPRIPYNYTNKEKWDTFFTNGRPIFHKRCLLLCDVLFETGIYTFWEESHSHLPGEHAVIKGLRHISTKEQEDDTFARFVSLYLSYSPCPCCADFLIDFSSSRPKCQFSVGFSCLFNHEEVRQRDGLRRLNDAPKVFIGVFTDLEWKRVAEATGVPFHHHSPYRQSGDLKWKAEFEIILKEQPGTTALRPSVPSQERDLTPVIIRPTDIAPDQGVTAGTATSSGLSQGHASWMWWQSSDGREEAGTIVLRPSVPSHETDLTPVVIRPTHIAPVESSSAEVSASSGLSQGRAPRMWWQSSEAHREKPGNTALRPSVPSQKRDMTSVTTRSTHIAQDHGSTAGAATSSVLSEGRSSRMCLQSSDGQHEEPGNTALRPSVTSQKRDMTSFTTRSTHIAQDQGSTAGAATSSVLSEGRSSKISWQSCDEQWIELLDAGKFERAKPRNTALRPSVPSQERDLTPVTIQRTHIAQDQGSTAGTAISSGSSAGHASATCLQSSHRQREEPGNTALRSSMPSHERGLSSVTIRSTHIAQDEGSSTGASTISGCSGRRAFRLWWQSRDEQQENLLDAVTAETAERDGAVTGRVKKRCVYCVIITVVIVVIVAVTLLIVLLRD